MPLTIQDLTAIQAHLPDHPMELVNGDIIVMSPSGYESDETAMSFGAQLWSWVHPRKLGRVTGAGAGFTLPSDDTRAPDVSFVRADRLRKSPRAFAELAPDLMVEVKSPTDSLTKLREKIQSFLSQGTSIGILIDPEKRLLEVHRLHQDLVLLKDGDTLTLPDLLPGWQVVIADLWPLEFD